MFDGIVKRGHYSEKSAAELMRKLLSGVHVLHSNAVIHRDLKPENCLLIVRQHRCVSVCVCVCVCVSLWACLFVSLFVCLSVCLCACLHVCVSRGVSLGRMTAIPQRLSSLTLDCQLTSLLGKCRKRSWGRWGEG